MFVLTTICLSLFLFRRYLVIILLRNYGKFSKFMNFRHKHFIYSDWSILSKPLHISYELCVLSGFMYPFFCSFELAAGIRSEMSITYSILFYYFNYYLQTLQTCLQPELNNNTATELSPFQYNFDRQVLSMFKLSNKCINIISRSIQVWQLSWWSHSTPSYQSPTSWSCSYSWYSCTATFQITAIAFQLVRPLAIQIFFNKISLLSSSLPFSYSWTGIRNILQGQSLLIKEQSIHRGLLWM